MGTNFFSIIMPSKRKSRTHIFQRSRTRSRRRSCSQPKGVKIVEEIEETSDLETSHENEDEISHHEHDEEEEVPENVRFSCVFFMVYYMYIHFISQIYCADQIKEIITKNQNTVSQNFLPIWFVFEKIHCNQTMSNFILFFYLFCLFVCFFNRCTITDNYNFVWNNLSVIYYLLLSVLK